MKEMTASDRLYVFSVAGWIVWALGTNKGTTIIGFATWVFCLLLSTFPWEDK